MPVSITGLDAGFRDMDMPATRLPERFADLDRFVEKWDLPDINSRYSARLASSMDDMQAFNDAMVVRAEDIKSWLDGRGFDDYTDADRCLARLMFAYAVVAQSVEIYKQPAVPDAGNRMFDVVLEPKM